MNINIATLRSPSFDLATATADHIHFAFIVKLPFRLRVASPYHLHFAYQNNNFDIWIQNKAFVPSDTVNNDESIWSTVAVIPSKSRIKPEELAALQNCQEPCVQSLYAFRYRSGLEAKNALNAFVVAFYNATGEGSGGHHLRPLTLDEFSDLIYTQVDILGIACEYWSEETIHELFDLQGGRYCELLIQTDEMSDLPTEKLAGISQAIDRLDSFYFYELAFEARAKMIDGDQIGGLLMAVAALEGAHGAFVSHVLATKLPTDRKGQEKQLEEEFIKELGFALCNKLTPYLFMTEHDRPPRELIRDVGKAITYRNEVMHALRTKAGDYRIRTRNNSELYKATHDALRLFHFYRRAIERAVSPDGALSGEVEELGSESRCHIGDSLPGGETGTGGESETSLNHSAGEPRTGTQGKNGDGPENRPDQGSS